MKHMYIRGIFMLVSRVLYTSFQRSFVGDGQIHFEQRGFKIIGSVFPEPSSMEIFANEIEHAQSNLKYRCDRSLSGF